MVTKTVEKPIVTHETQAPILKQEGFSQATNIKAGTMPATLETVTTTTKKVPASGIISGGTNLT